MLRAGYQDRLFFWVCYFGDLSGRRDLWLLPAIQRWPFVSPSGLVNLLVLIAEKAEEVARTAPLLAPGSSVAQM